MLRAAKLLCLLLGIGAGAYLVYSHGPAIRDSLLRVGWSGFVLYLAASFVVYFLDTLGWRLTFVEGQRDTPLMRLFCFRMAGEAVNKVTPLASMGGEPLKGYLLARDGATLHDGIASVAIAKNVMTLAQIAFVWVAVALAWGRIPGQEKLLLGLTAFPSLIFAAMMVTAVLDLQLRRRKRAGIVEVEVEKPSRKQQVVALWTRVADFFWAHPRAFTLSLVVFFAGWAAGALEVLVGAWVLGFSISPTDALVLEGLLASINMATFFIPANAGSQEGGFAFLAPLLGLTTANGVALAVLRRCRDVVWVLFGLAYLAITEGRVLFRPEVTPEPAA